MRKRCAIISIILVVLACITAGCASAPAPAPRPVETATPAAPVAPAEPFKPATPEPKKFDWILLTSGEWLKGDITVMRDDSLEFDSDQLDDLKLDWEKIAEVRSPRPNSILIDDGESGAPYTGKLLVTRDSVVITNEEGEQRFERNKLLVIVPGEPSEKNYWDGTVSLGISGKAGNVNQTDISLYALARRRTLESRWTTTYNGAFGSVEGEATVDNHRLSSRYDWFIGRKWYLTPLVLEYYRDIFTNIEHQITPAAQVGYHVIDTSKMEWDLEAGGGYRYTAYNSVEPGEPDSTGTAAIVAGTRFSWDITGDIEFQMNYQIQVGVPKTADTNQNAFLALSIDLIGDIDLDLSLTWNRTGNPRADSDGTVPQSDDLRYTVGLGWDF